jgi:hypothetical protein
MMAQQTAEAARRRTSTAIPTGPEFRTISR